MRKTFKGLVIFILLFSISFGIITTVNAEYTKMWWEYIDECSPNDVVDGDIVYINSNNVLCISNLDTSDKRVESTIEVLNNVKDVFISPYQKTKAVLMLDGTMYCWGDTVMGYDRAYDEIKVPQMVLRDVVSMDCGVDHVGALTSDGTLRVWGFSMFYDYFHVRMNIDDFEVTNVQQFEIDNNSFAILKDDGSLWILGYWSKDKEGFDPNGIYKQWHLVDTNVKYIDVNSGNLAYIKNNGDLWMIGSNYFGELATPRALLEYTFAPIKIAHNVEKVSLSMWNTMFLKTDGSVYSVGYAVQSDVPQWIANNIVAIDSPYIQKRDGTLLKLTGGEYNDYKVVKSLINIKLDDIYMPIVVTYNDKNIAFDQQPVIDNDRTLVPLRAIFEALGADVIWDAVTQTVIANKDGIKISLKIGDINMYVGDSAKLLDVPAKIINDRTMVPVRAISEALDCMVAWNTNTKTVTIIDK